MARLTATTLEVSESEAASLLGYYSAALRGLDYLRDMGDTGPYRTAAELADTRRKVRENIDALADELHQLTSDPAQLPLFDHKASHATH